MQMPNTRHFKTPQDIIEDYYQQKHIESVVSQKPTKFLTLARGNNKRLLRELYLKEHLLELYLAETGEYNADIW